MEVEKILKEIAVLFHALVEEVVATKLADKLTVVEEVAPVPVVTPVKEVVVASKPVQFPIIQEVAEVVKPTEKEEVIDEVQRQVNEAVADMTDDEIKEVLSSYGISTRGKRQALISKVYDAVRNGQIVFEEAAEEVSAETQQTPEVAEEPVADEPTEEAVEVPVTYFEQFDPLFRIDPNREPDSAEEVMGEDYFPGNKTTSKLRYDACVKSNEEVDALFNLKKMRPAEIKPVLDAFYGIGATDFVKDEKERYKLLQKALARKIDDEGNTHNFGEVYIIEGYQVCCGHYLTSEEGQSETICPICGGVYPIE